MMEPEEALSSAESATKNNVHIESWLIAFLRLSSPFCTLYLP